MSRRPRSRGGAWIEEAHGPLLGVRPDTEIAAMAGISFQAVAKRRKDRGIPAVRVVREADPAQTAAREALRAAQDADPARAEAVFDRRLGADVIGRLPTGAARLLVDGLRGGA